MTEYSTAGNKDICASFTKTTAGVEVNSTVNFNKSLRTGAFYHGTQRLHFVYCVFDKTLTSETRIDAHKKHHIHISDDVFKYGYRCGRIKGDTCVHTIFVNLTNYAVEMGACFVVYIHHICSQCLDFLNEFFRLDNHKVDIKWFFT